MSNEPIVKVCKHHGDLTIAQVNVTGKNVDGAIRYKCKLCQKLLHEKNYLKNKDKILSRAAAWRAGESTLTREQYLIWKRESNAKRYATNAEYREECLRRIKQWDIDNPERARARRNKSKRKIWAELGDYCVKQDLKKRFDFKTNEIHPKIIGLNRIIMKVKRAIKGRKKCQK